MTAEQQQSYQLQHQQQQQHMQHFQHYIRSDYGSDSVSLSSKLRHYSLTETTSFGARRFGGTSAASGGSGGGMNAVMAQPSARQINGRSCSYGSLQ